MKIIGQLKAILGLDKSRFDQGLNGAEKKANSFGSVIKKIGGILAAAFSVGAIIRFSKEAMRMAAEIEGIKNAYTKFGAEGTRVLKEMKTATRGVIQEDELMRLAVKAQSLGISFKDLGIYLKFATDQAIRLGRPVQEFADIMITAVGRQQARGLVQIGIATKEAAAAFKGADGIIGFVTKKLEEMGPVADTIAIKMEQLKVSGIELKEAWGAWLNKSPVISAFRSYFTDLLKAWADESMTFMQKAAMLLPYYGGQKGEKKVWKRGQAQTEKERAAEGANIFSPGYIKGVQKFQQSVQTENKKTEKTIADLRLEIEDYKALIEATTISDQARRTELLKQIQATEELIKSYTTLERAVIKIEKIKIAVPNLGGGFPKASGLQPAPGKPSEAEHELATIEAVTAELEKQELAVGILSSAFDALFTSTEDGFKAMIDSIITSIKRLLAELLARVAILTLLNILTGGGVKFGTILKSAFTSMGIAQGAAGGTVPSGYPHDTFPALLSSGETILTSEQSRNFNRKIDIHVTGDIAGRAIALVGRRTESEN
jgi:hypothetical protein